MWRESRGDLILILREANTDSRSPDGFNRRRPMNNNRSLCDRVHVSTTMGLLVFLYATLVTWPDRVRLACCRSVACNNYWGMTCHAPLSACGVSIALGCIVLHPDHSFKVCLSHVMNRYSYSTLALIWVEWPTHSRLTVWPHWHAW